MYDLQAFLSPDGYLGLADPYMKIQCIVIVKRVHGPATKDPVADIAVRVPKKMEPRAPATFSAARQQQ